MRYSFYSYFGEEVNVFRLYTQMREEGMVKCYEFQTNVKGISNEPGITRLFGKEVFDIAGNYFLFPLDFDNVEIGEFTITQENEKFTRLFFVTKEGNTLSGEWILRNLTTGQVLFWKPLPVVFNMPTGGVTIKEDDTSNFIEVEQRFSIFELETDGGSFHGVAAAEGIWTGQDFNTTLFTGKIIQSLGEQLNDSMTSMIVDRNHDFINDGGLDTVSIKERKGVKYIEVSGFSNTPIPPGSGLSITIKSEIKWDNILNVWVLMNASPIGVSIITESRPACTICMIR